MESKISSAYSLLKMRRRFRKSNTILQILHLNIIVSVSSIVCPRHMLVSVSSVTNDLDLTHSLSFFLTNTRALVTQPAKFFGWVY